MTLQSSDRGPHTHARLLATSAIAAARPSPDAMTFTIAGAIALSGLSRSRLYRLSASGEVLFRKVGSRTIVDGPSLRAFLAALPAATIRTAA